jgi:hypothetical protein
MCSDHPPDLISGDHSSVKRPDRVITISDSGYTLMGFRLKILVGFKIMSLRPPGFPGGF